MRLIQHSAIATILLVVAGLSLMFAFGWEPESGLRVLAFLGSGVWVYALVAQLFLMQAHTQGEIDRSMNEWRFAFPQPHTPRVGGPSHIIEGDVSPVERLIPVHTTAPQITPVVVAPTPPGQREIELPSGQRLPRADVEAFVDGLDSKGHTRKDWIGFRAPSGKVVDSVYFQSLIGAVRVAGEFPVYGQGVRAKRILTTAEIRTRLHLD